MRSNNLLLCAMLWAALALLPIGCGGGGGGGGPSGPALSSITVTPAGGTISAGATQQFSATGTFSDGSTRDITGQVTWSSSSGVVQIVANTGLATASGSNGTATITATSGSVFGSTLVTVTGGSAAGANVMSITVNGSLCSNATSAGYLNKPCVSVTVCNPGSATCQTVNDILLDTGSYGLRIFSSALTGLTLPQASSILGGSLAECTQFVDGSSLWGPVKQASVQLGGEPAVQMPIQVIDASFASVPASCGSPDATPAAAGFTGILGVGSLAQDCGPGCVNAPVGIYFSCVGTTCTGTSVPLANQVQNPVASLPVDRTGVLVSLPAVPTGGIVSIDGSLILGIGTQPNNTPSVAPTVLPTDSQGDFRTTFEGVSFTSFLDTGSNALFFPSSLLPLCSNNPADPLSNWYCPPATTLQTATQVGAPGSPSKTVQFNISNFNTLISSNNDVFSDVGGPSTFGFDWGLPFFMGRNVYVGISGRTAPGVGTGPYIAY